MVYGVLVEVVGQATPLRQFVVGGTVGQVGLLQLGLVVGGWVQVVRLPGY